jgi:DNA-binding NarL/FixJ family response regulator
MSDATNRIAFLDDRPATAETVVNGLAPLMPKGWEIIACPMQADPAKYSRWIDDNHVTVFIVDQLLNEHPSVNGTCVSYKGHDVIVAVRKRLPELPIVVATRATEEPELMEHLGDADEIVSRTALVDNAAQYIKRFIRLGRKFVEAFERDLSDLSTLSAKSAAGGKLTKEEKYRLKGIQVKLNLVSVEHPLDDVIGKIEKEIQQLQDLHDKAARVIKSTPSGGKRATKRKRS